MGPPIYFPSSSETLVATAIVTSTIFVVMQTKLAIHIQKIAPGPPKPIAVATPTIFPAPIVPARAVETASKGEIEFSSDFESLTSLPKVFLKI